jgi:ferric-chelate reductase [NAD(P)H]
MDLQALFKISYGLYVIAAKHQEMLSGYISNTVFQVTAEPPRLATCCALANFTCDLIRNSGAFSVAVLSQETPQEIFQRFGYRSGRNFFKFNDIDFKIGSTGAPIVIGHAIAYYECQVIQTVEVGTHLIFIADLVDSQLLDPVGIPMTYAYYREVRRAKAPKNAPTFLDPKKVAAR